MQCKTSCSLWANSGLMQCSKKDCYSITSSAIWWRWTGTPEAQRLCGLEVDHKLIPRRRLHGEVSRLRAFEDAVDVLWRALSLRYLSTSHIRSRFDPIR
jgi:hypothetical protein